MRADLRRRLLAVARGEFSRKEGVTPVTGVTGHSGYVSKPLELRQVRALRVKNHQLEKEVAKGVTEPVTHPLELDDAMPERFAIIEEDGTVPAMFREAWARLNCACPAGILEDLWLRAIVSGGPLLDVWGSRAAELRWCSDELFAPEFGLVWVLGDLDGAAVNSLDRDSAYITTRVGERQLYRRRWKQ
jgi:hypothetical protein